MIELGMWFIFGLSLIGTIGNLYKRRWCFLFWAGTNVFWISYDIYKTAYPQAVMMFVYLILAIVGWFKWKEEK